MTQIVEDRGGRASAMIRVKARALISLAYGATLMRKSGTSEAEARTLLKPARRCSTDFVPSGEPSLPSVVLDNMERSFQYCGCPALAHPVSCVIRRRLRATP